MIIQALMPSVDEKKKFCFPNYQRAVQKKAILSFKERLIISNLMSISYNLKNTNII